jgi:hypothetical protein
MITSILHHGLGNRLYQIIYTIELAKKYNMNYFFSDYYTDNIEHKFNIHYKDNIFKKLSFNYVDKIPYLDNKYIFDKHKLKQIKSDFKLKKEKLINIEDIFNLLNDNNTVLNNDETYVLNFPHDNPKSYYIESKYVDRYFYNDLFIDKQILNDIKIKYNNNFKNSICILVRRNDYCTNEDLKPRVKDILYYYKGIKEIEKEKQIDYIYIISDDFNWCKKNLIDSRIIYVDDVDYNQFYLATLCENFITVDSTFIFWPIVLSLNDNIIVVSEKDSIHFSYKDKSWNNDLVWFTDIKSFKNISKHITI